MTLDLYETNIYLLDSIKYDCIRECIKSWHVTITTGTPSTHKEILPAYGLCGSEYHSLILSFIQWFA